MKLKNLKENWQKISDKTRRLIIALAGGTLAIALIGILVLQLTNTTEYGVLFTGLNQEEAQEVAGLLNEQGVDYQYDAENGTIQVPQEQEEQLRADLLSQGYPKSGFTYDMRRDNTGIMTTESDKEQYTLYELQDRLGATIRLFDGVSDAKVTIAAAETSRYALSDNSATEASASATITMDGSNELTERKAEAIKNLIARSVQGMNFTNVSVFDAGTMLEVGAGSTDSELSSSQDMTALTTLIESNIATNIRRVLGQLYGEQNIAVSVKGTLNMEKLIQENTEYSTPEKIDENDKTGLMNREEVQGEESLAAGQGEGGVAGTDANADTPTYANEDEGETTTEEDSYGSASREWLYNTLKEQREVDPGVLEDTTVGVVINTNDTSVAEADLMNLIANSAGIPLEQAAQKISVIRAPGTETQVTDPNNADTQQDDTEQTNGSEFPWLPVLIGGGVAAILLLLLLILLLRRRKKRAANEMPAEMQENYLANSAISDANDDFPVDEGVDASFQKLMGGDMEEEEDEFARQEEDFNTRMRRSLKLKENVSDFVDQNPQIAAKLIQSWLREEEDGGRRHG